MTGCQARITAAHNSFHTYTCGRGVKRTIGEFGLCGIHARVLDRNRFIYVWDKDGLHTLRLSAGLQVAEGGSGAK